MSTQINLLFDALQQQIDQFTKGNPFGYFVKVGTLIAAVLMTFWAWYMALNPLVMALAVFICLLLALLLGKLTQIFFGTEQYVFYHYLILTALGLAVAAWLTGLPVWTALDIFAIGMAGCHASGRLGCLFAGCCHGTLARWGVCYRHDHSHEGLRLLPIQGTATIGIGTLCLINMALLVTQPAGIAFAHYVAAYALLRFVLEFWRGDTNKFYWQGYNEPQLISIGLSISILLLHLFVPLPLWLLLIPLITLSLVALGRLLQAVAPRLWYRLNAPRFRAEWSLLNTARALPAIQSAFRRKPHQEPYLLYMPLSRLQLSRSRVKAPGGMQHALTISNKRSGAIPKLLLVQLMRFWQQEFQTSQLQLVEGSHAGIWHILCLEPAADHSREAVWEGMQPNADTVQMNGKHWQVV